MNGNIGIAVEHGGFQLFNKQTFATDFGQWRVEYLVAFGGEGHQLNGQTRMQRFQPGLYVFSLPHRQWAFAGGDTQGFDGIGWRGLARHTVPYPASG